MYKYYSTHVPQPPLLMIYTVTQLPSQRLDVVFRSRVSVHLVSFTFHKEAAIFVSIPSCSFSQMEPQQIHYSNSEGQYPGGSSSVSVATLPFHPALLDHYLPQVPPTSRRAEGQGTPTSLPRDRERERERQPYSEGEESDGGERSEGELVLLTD